jgi:YD repeat-containing protein
VECPDSIAIEFWWGRKPKLVNCTVLGQVKEGGDPGLIAYWKLDETAGVMASDSAGEHDGTVMGNPLWRPDGGKAGGALELSGAGNNVATELVCNPAAGPFGVFAWVKGGAPGQVILSQAGGANWLMASASDGALVTELKSSGRTGKALKSVTSVTDGAWHRVGFVWDGSSRILCVDDVEVARDTQASLAGSAGNLSIGAGSTMAPTSFWKGLIDDVRIYDRAVKP